MSLTITEKILSNASGTLCNAGDYVVVNVDWVMIHDSTGPLSIQGLNEIGKPVWNPKKVVIVFDHFYPAPSLDAARLHKISKSFIKDQELTEFRIDGVCHQLLVEDYVSPGEVIVGADSHTCTEGALGTFSTGMGSTDIAGAMATGKTWLRVPESIEVNLIGTAEKCVYAKDVILELARRIKSEGALYKALEFTGNYVDAVSMSSRLTLCNMAVELGAKNGVIEADSKTYDLTRRKGRLFKSDPDALYSQRIDIDVGELSPMIACPSSVDNVVPVSEVEGTKLDQVLIGTCTNGRLDDIEIAAKILKGKKVPNNVRLIVVPASYKIYKEAQRLGYTDVIYSAGGIVSAPSCGPCIGRHGGVLAEDEVCLSTQNRNFTGRMGSPESKIYLVSPATAAASALEGRIVEPRNHL